MADDTQQDPPAGGRALAAQLQEHLQAQARLGVQWLNLPALPQPLVAAAEALPGPGAQPARPPAAGEHTLHSQPAGADAGGGRQPLPTLVQDEAQGLAAQAETLEELAQRFADCQQCKLSQGRNCVVFGVGAPRPRLLFVGEGPGAEEDAQGEPFVGRAGQLLTGLIQALGLVREDVYITNVVKCRPPKNRNPEADEINACLPILRQQLALLQPQLIVALGNVPLRAFNPQAAGITRERGRLCTFENYPVLPTFHPSYLLRNPNAIQATWEDFRQAATEVYGEL